MLDVLQFVFSSFWVWAGSVVLLALAIKGIVLIVLGIAAMFSKHNVNIKS